ncbi:hypothetical protein [Rubritalea tangerina]
MVHDTHPYLLGVKGTHRPQRFLTHFPHAHYNSLFSTLRDGDYKVFYN